MTTHQKSFKQFKMEDQAIRDFFRYLYINVSLLRSDPEATDYLNQVLTLGNLDLKDLERYGLMKEGKFIAADESLQRSFIMFTLVKKETII